MQCQRLTTAWRHTVTPAGLSIHSLLGFQDVSSFSPAPGASHLCLLPRSPAKRVSPPSTLCNCFPVPAPVPPAPVTQEDSKNWSSIQRGTATALESLQNPPVRRKGQACRGMYALGEAQPDQRLVRAGLRCRQPRRSGCPRLHS